MVYYHAAEVRLLQPGQMLLYWCARQHPELVMYGLMVIGLHAVAVTNGEKAIGHLPGKNIMFQVTGRQKEMAGTGSGVIGVEKITHER